MKTADVNSLIVWRVQLFIALLVFFSFSGNYKSRLQHTTVSLPKKHSESAAMLVPLVKILCTSNDKNVKLSMNKYLLTLVTCSIFTNAESMILWLVVMQPDCLQTFWCVYWLFIDCWFNVFCLAELIAEFDCLFSHVWYWSGSNAPIDLVACALSLQQDLDYDVRMAFWYTCITWYIYH